MGQHDFTEILTRAVELADGENGWQSCVVGDPDDPDYAYTTQSLRTEVMTYEGSVYRVVIIGPLDPDDPNWCVHPNWYPHDPFYWVDFNRLIAPGLTRHLNRWSYAYTVLSDIPFFAKQQIKTAWRIVRHGFNHE